MNRPGRNKTETLMQQSTFVSEPERAQDLRKMAVLLDSKYQGPFGLRFGWDGILGFIPGVGNMVTDLFSFYIVLQAAQMGCPPIVLTRMGLNILIDNLVSAVPLLGYIFDFMWKSNVMNMALLDRYLLNPKKAIYSSRFLVTFVIVMCAALMASGIFLTVWLFKFLFDYFQTSW